MSTAATEFPPSHPVISNENLLFDYPGADVILRSSDSYEFRVLKVYIVHSSPILGEKVLISPSSQPEPAPGLTPTSSAGPDVEDVAANALCVVQLPIEGAILFSLLTYIFSVPPVLPSTVEHVMELLSVAQLYEMGVVLTHIRHHIAQQEPPLIRKETAFFIYSFSLKRSLRPEALQAAECTLSFASLTIEDLAEENVLDTMPGAFLHELWKYHQRVRSNLSLDLEEFEMSDAVTILGDSSCTLRTDSNIPSWLEHYISTIGTGRVPAFLDLTDFHLALAEHGRNAKRGHSRLCGYCSTIPRESIRELWGALTAVVRDSISKAESDFAFPIDGTLSEGLTREAASPLKYTNMPNADVILQSSSLINFRVHKSVLATSSPFFSDMFTLPLPQPPNGTASDELPVVHVSEDAVILNSLISMLYPVPPEMPISSDDSLALLVAAAKYDMDTIRSSIREEISRKKLFSWTLTGLFRVYATAYRKTLIPEMAMAARLTLGHPLTFESIGHASRLFEGCALRDLADFRLRSIRKFSELLLDCDTESSNIWASCPMANRGDKAPSWFEDLQSRLIQVDKFTQAIPTSQKLHDEYLTALQSHIDISGCQFCMKAHVKEGDIFRTKLRDVSIKAWNVPHPMEGE